MGKTIESKAAKTILQKPETIKVGNETFEVAPPSTATLILLSEAVSKLPNYKLDEDRLFTEVLATAQDCKPLGEIGAILILGAKRINERRKLFGIINRKSEKDRLSQKLLTDLTPRELNEVIAKILQSLEIGNFFGLTTSLTEVNLLRQTRGVVTTASGQ